MLSKPTHQWVYWCQKLIQCNLNTIPMKRWQQSFTTLNDFSSKVKSILLKYCDWEDQENLFNKSKIHIEELRAKIYSIIVIKEQGYTPKDQITRFSQMVKFLSKRKTFRDRLKKTSSNKFQKEIEEKNFQNAFKYLYGEKAYNDFRNVVSSDQVQKKKIEENGFWPSMDESVRVTQEGLFNGKGFGLLDDLDQPLNSGSSKEDSKDQLAKPNPEPNTDKNPAPEQLSSVLSDILSSDSNSKEGKNDLMNIVSFKLKFL